MRTSRRTGSIGAHHARRGQQAVDRRLEHGGGQTGLGQGDLGGADAVHAHRRHGTARARIRGCETRATWTGRRSIRRRSTPRSRCCGRPGERTLRWFRAADLEVERKGDGTPVTAADRDAERFLRERLAEAFPGDGVLGEEEAPTDGTTGRRWILDPIDGTKAFTCGVPLYSNLLALEDEHGIAVGVINLPALGETVWAGRGLGLLLRAGPGAR